MRKRIGKTLAEALRPHAAELARFAASGRPVFSTAPSDRWDDVFPMVVPPEGEDGLGIILLNSNADSHFSFTNALGMISAAQANAMDTIFAQHPKACWLIGLHHHPVEYPRAAKVLSERIGTTLVNGNWFLRRLSADGAAARSSCTATGTSTGSANAAASSSSPRRRR